ncbi:MAG: HD domain-containing protein [Bdellovibrionales bacterium]
MKLDNAAAVQLADVFERTLGVYSIIRYHNQIYWKDESAQHDIARAAEGPLRLESVADHTWHLQFMATALLPYFPQLDARKVHELTALHDVLELITGDRDPGGADGQGTDTHAFNAAVAQQVEDEERAALEQYLTWFPPSLHDHQRALHDEMIACATPESSFVKVLDKIQPLIYIKIKKNGTLPVDDLRFLVKYRAKHQPRFPELAPLYDECFRRLVADTARHQGHALETLAVEIGFAA